MVLRSNIHSFSGLQQVPYKAVLNTDVPLVTIHISWDGVKHATWYFWTRCCNRVHLGVQYQCVAASLNLVRSMLPLVVWQAVSVCLSTQKQKVSERTQMLRSTLSLWSHTHIWYRCCVKQNRSKRHHQQMWKVSAVTDLKISPPAQTDNQQMKRSDTLTFLRTTDTVWLMTKQIRHRNLYDWQTITKHTQAVCNCKQLVNVSPYSHTNHTKRHEIKQLAIPPHISKVLVLVLGPGAGKDTR
jgi:hypothetical protein